MQVCLSFVLNQPQLDGIVIGYNSTQQLNQILKLKQMKNDFLLPGEIIKILDKKNKAIKVPHIGWKELYPKLKHFISNSAHRQKAGQPASQTVYQHRGAVLRNVKIIEETRPG